MIVLLSVRTYNMVNLPRRAALPRSVRHWTLMTLRENPVKIRGKGCVPRPECVFPDGGGCGSAQIIPIHPKDYASRVENGFMNTAPSPTRLVNRSVFSTINTRTPGFCSSSSSAVAGTIFLITPARPLFQ